MLLFQCSLLFSLVFCVRTENSQKYALKNSASELDRFSYWPTISNGLRLREIRKRNVDLIQNTPGPSEGNAAVEDKPHPSASDPSKPASTQETNQTKIESVADVITPSLATQKEDIPKQETHKVSGRNETAIVSPTNNNVTANTSFVKLVKTPSTQMDLSNPGAIKRASIVFGGFLLLGVAYFIFYRKKRNKNDPINTHNATDANQFRYGVLQSDDRRDNLELSQVPLTMESDDDDDEDLEIFDLGQKKKSLSYVNLETNDEEIVFDKELSKDEDEDNLLLDIEDEASDTLINWSNNSNNNKSIL